MADRVIKGRARMLGDYVNTDVIAPGRWMQESLDVLRLHTMEAIRPEFYRDVTAGDIIVAGRNFGCGSHREAATSIMRVLGISAIVADSVGRLYFRNGMAFGLPVFSAPGVSAIVAEGEEMEIVMGVSKVTIRNLTRGGEVTCPPIPDIMARIMDAGGVYPLLKRRLAEGT